MKRHSIYLLILFLAGGVFGTPFFVWASDICLVGEGADKPYQKISEAIEADCKEIKISQGLYKEDLTFKQSTIIFGEDREEVIIEGKVFIEDGVEIEGITFSRGGVEIADGANVNIENSIIKDSITTGIITNGGGKLILFNVVISGNKKGTYFKAGKEIKIISCEIYGNSEEGLDIRANTKGIIAHNQINQNGESGIEVILGNTEMDIFENEINDNMSSGIAAQFYKESLELGDIKIRDNSMLENENYGLDCKTPSGGDGRPKGYYMNSLLMSNNKVFGNRKKEISSGCKFDDREIFDITQTKEGRLDEIAKLEKNKSLSDIDKKDLEEMQFLNQREDDILQINSEKENILESVIEEIKKVDSENLARKEKIEERGKWKIFWLGEDYQEIKNIKDSLLVYEQKIKLLKEEKERVTSPELLNKINEQVKSLNKNRQKISDFVADKGNKFSIFGWWKKNKIS